MCLPLIMSWKHTHAIKHSRFIYTLLVALLLGVWCILHNTYIYICVYNVCVHVCVCLLIPPPPTTPHISIPTLNKKNEARQEGEQQEKLTQTNDTARGRSGCLVVFLAPLCIRSSCYSEYLLQARMHACSITIIRRRRKIMYVPDWII